MVVNFNTATGKQKVKKRVFYFNDPSGNMFADHGTGSPVAGYCEHECIYCYMNTLKKLFPGVRQKYTGDPRLDERMMTNRWAFKKGTKVGFLQDCGDLCANNVPTEMIKDVLNHARTFPLQYLLLTKNPNRYFEIMETIKRFRKNLRPILGATIETNSFEYQGREISKAPDPLERMNALARLNYDRKMVSIEPVMKFDLKVFPVWIQKMNLSYFAIGADSGNHRLNAPTNNELNEFLWQTVGITEVRVKKNLLKKYTLDEELVPLVNTG